MNSVIESLRRWQERRTAIRQLAAMPDHLLHDIGVERGNIQTIVSGLQARQRLAEGARSRPCTAAELALLRG